MLVSKEYYIYSPETWHALGLTCAIAFVLKQGGSYIADIFEDSRVVSFACFASLLFSQTNSLQKSALP